MRKRVFPFEHSSHCDPCPSYLQDSELRAKPFLNRHLENSVRPDALDAHVHITWVAEAGTIARQNETYRGIVALRKFFSFLEIWAESKIRRNGDSFCVFEKYF